MIRDEGAWFASLQAGAGAGAEEQGLVCYVWGLDDQGGSWNAAEIGGPEREMPSMH